MISFNDTKIYFSYSVGLTPNIINTNYLDNLTYERIVNITLDLDLNNSAVELHLYN